jgi:DNA repair protein RecO (recombination protein O)
LDEYVPLDDAHASQFPAANNRRARLYRTTAIVLRRREIGEANRILTFLTEQQGRIRVVAKGVRRPGSRLAGHLEPFCVTSVLVARTKGLDIVSQAELTQAFATLRTDEAAIATAGYLSELVDLLLPEEQPQEGVFDLTRASLELLDGGRDRRHVTFVFTMGLLRHLGYRPQLDPCILCGAPLAPETNGFSIEGGVVCQRCAASRAEILPLSVSALKLMRAVDRGEIERVLGLRVTLDVWRETDAVLAAYISRIAGREPGAPRVLRELRLE